MTAVSIPSRITPEELLRMPDNNSLELVNGQIVEKQVSAESSEIEGAFTRILGNFVCGNNLAKVYPASLGYQCFSHDPMKVRKPDVSVITVQRLVQLPDQNPGYMPIVPDLAIEVLSPNDVIQDVNDKIHEYLAANFPLVWVVDPGMKTITAYRPDGPARLYQGDEEIVAENALPGFKCKVSNFFPESVVKKA